MYWSLLAFARNSVRATTPSSLSFNFKDLYRLNLIRVLTVLEFMSTVNNSMVYDLSKSFILRSRYSRPLS